jgi:CBS domain-containing protein
MELTDSVRAVLDGKGSNVYSITPTNTVYDAVERMAQLSVGALVVQDGEKVVGIISERDYARKIILEGRTSRDASVRDIMSVNLVTVSPAHTVDACMKLLTNHRIRHLPVVEDTKIVGMITAGDLVNWVITRQNETIEQLEHYISNGYVR